MGCRRVGAWSGTGARRGEAATDSRSHVAKAAIGNRQSQTIWREPPVASAGTWPRAQLGGNPDGVPISGRGDGLDGERQHSCTGFAVPDRLLIIASWGRKFMIL